MVSSSGLEAEMPQLFAPTREGEVGRGLEWARIAEDVVLVASAERAWLHPPLPRPQTDPFAVTMVGYGTLETTRNLLDAAVAISRLRFAAVETPPFTLTQYLWRLVGAYHSTHATPRFMGAAEARFRANGRPDLAAM